MMERVEKGHRTALDLALEGFAEVRAEQAAKQGDLFADGVDNLPEVVAPLAADGLGAADGQRSRPSHRRTGALVYPAQ